MLRKKPTVTKKYRLLLKTSIVSFKHYIRCKLPQPNIWHTSDGFVTDTIHYYINPAIDAFTEPINEKAIALYSRWFLYNEGIINKQNYNNLHFTCIYMLSN